MVTGANPFIWKNPNDSQWYLFFHDTGGAGYRICYRTAASLADMDSASTVPVLDFNIVTAAPTVFYRDGLYWLIVEEWPNEIWRNSAFYSSSISGPYTRWGIVNSADDACSIILKYGSTLYYYYSQQTNKTSVYWDIVLRTADY